MKPLTERQCDLLVFLKTYPHDYAPSYREMADGLGLVSKSGINRLIVALEARGFIERIPDTKRSIRVLDKPKAFASPRVRTKVQTIYRRADVTSFPTKDLMIELSRRGFTMTA